MSLLRVSGRLKGEDNITISDVLARFRLLILGIRDPERRRDVLGAIKRLDTQEMYKLFVLLAQLHDINLPAEWELEF